MKKPTPHDELADLANEMKTEIAKTVNQSTISRPTTLSDINRMSAEAVYAQYESAAVAVEDMGAAARERIVEIEDVLLAEIADSTTKQIAHIQEMMMAEVSEAAATIRDSGKRAQALVEEVGAMSRTIRDSCIDFKRKVGVQ